MVDHKLHDFAFIQEIAAEQIGKIQTLLAGAHSRTATVQASLVAIAEVRERVAVVQRTSVEQIESTFASLQKELDARKGNALADVRAVCDVKRKHLDAQEGELQMFLGHLSSSHEQVRATPRPIPLGCRCLLSSGSARVRAHSPRICTCAQSACTADFTIPICMHLRTIIPIPLGCRCLLSSLASWGACV